MHLEMGLFHVKLTVIEHKHWIVDYVVELKERIPDLNEYGADQMSYYAEHVVGLFLPRDFFDNFCDYWRECVRIANEGGRCILNPDGLDNKYFSLSIRRGHVRRIGGNNNGY